jgi:hypothetical protein
MSEWYCILGRFRFRLRFQQKHCDTPAIRHGQPSTMIHQQPSTIAAWRTRRPSSIVHRPSSVVTVHLKTKTSCIVSLCVFCLVLCLAYTYPRCYPRSSQQHLRQEQQTALGFCLLLRCDVHEQWSCRLAFVISSFRNFVSDLGDTHNIVCSTLDARRSTLDARLVHSAHATTNRTYGLRSTPEDLRRASGYYGVLL